MGDFIKALSYEKLKPEQLKRQIELDKLQFDTTDELEPIETIIGQNKALNSLKIGTEIDAPGYNIFISGISGTGRLTTVTKTLKSIISSKNKELYDICYVYNFKMPDSPRLITLPKGRGREFSKDMESLIEFSIENLSTVFEEDIYLREKNRIIDKYQKINEKMYNDFSYKVASEGFKLVEVKSGKSLVPDIYPIINGKAKSIQELREEMSNDIESINNIIKIETELSLLQMELENTIRENNKLDKELKDELETLRRKTGTKILRNYIDDIIEKYWNPTLTAYLLEVQKSIVSNLYLFTTSNGATKGSIQKLIRKSKKSKLYDKYRVNVILDNSDTDSSPIVIETSPSYAKTFGTIEKTITKAGIIKTDFTKIKAGSLLQANGGFFIVNANDIISNEVLWNSLKKVLKYKKLEIKNIDGLLENTTSLKPEPIDINVKVIMIGDDNIYSEIFNNDEDFQKIFKINAEFDYKTELNYSTINDYARFIKKICNDENLLPFNKSAVASILEECLRKTESQKYITTKFGEIADLIRESNYWATKDSAKIVTKHHIKKTLKEIELRMNLTEERFREYVNDELILLQTDGYCIGQINVLTVYDIGNYIFGRPTKITAIASKGDNGIVNIEREVKLSGNIYDKSILILTGFLYNLYAKEKPINLNISICFEQSYDPIDGDSATLGEICAIISAMSGIPIKQYIAVTGSMNQKGDVQPIGGVTYKIEGFFDVCSMRGLTGKEGVIIPYSNIKDLMLKDEVIEAVEKGLFNIYAVKTVEQALEILTGYKMGYREENGLYPQNTINQFISLFLNDKEHDEITYN